MVFEIKRKLFHLMALLCVVGVMRWSRQQFVAIMGVLLIVDFVFEVLRLKNASLKAFMSRVAGTLLRKEEENRFSGVTWMLSGVLVTALLIQPRDIVVTIYLYLIFGDAAASLVGKSLKGPCWPRSEKTISGSAACFIVCVLCGMFYLRPFLGWGGVMVGAMAATLLEFGFLPVNDNFSIPVGTSLVLMAVYGLRPVFL